jgi:PBSX family phage terminase large subunit
MKVKLSKWQLEVANDPHRFKVICAGRRSGKSTYAQLQVLKWSLQSVGLYYIVSPTYKQSKSIHWRELKKIIPKNWIQKTNETELSFTLRNGSTIELKGAENPDALRGVKLKGLVIDEIASVRNWDWLWQEVLRPTLTDYEAPTIFISTPKGYNHFYELYLLGQGDNESYKSWRFTSYDNPYIPSQEIDNAKKELTEDTFYQEYMADFRKYTGLVYKEFQRGVHVIDPFPVPDGWQIYRGVDFGSTNPTACLWIAVDSDENIFVVDEHYKTGETIDYHAGVINSNPYSQRVQQSFGDPSGAQWINEFQQRGIYITPANKETGTNFNSWVRFGIEKVAERLKTTPGHDVPNLSVLRQPLGGLPKLFVFNTCTNLIREFETYRWKEKSVTQAQDLNEPDVPEKANDHAMDALRYFAVSYKKQDTDWDNVNQGLSRKWAI